jgi:predicted dienelactone hydrolase
MSCRTGVLALLLACFAAPLAQAGVGFQHLQIPDPEGPPIEVGVWYPTNAPATSTRSELGPVPLAFDAPLAGDRLPLVVMSHGTGASFASHADTAVALAQAGFVAAALTHTGDNWRDTNRAVRITDRPRQLKLLIDYMLADWRDHDRVGPTRVGAFGFSAGGFTVLAAAGGQPDLSRVRAHCAEHPGAFECGLVARSGSPPPEKGPVVHDLRIAAVVAAAPALGYTFEGGLAGVRQPVQLWRAETDQILPHPFYAEAVRRALPIAPEYHVVPNAGHYDFLAPCTPQIAQRVPEICQSAPGFDRTAFHTDFNREVVGFFKRTLEAQ